MRRQTTMAAMVALGLYMAGCDSSSPTAPTPQVQPSTAVTEQAIAGAQYTPMSAEAALQDSGMTIDVGGTPVRHASVHDHRPNFGVTSLAVDTVTRERVAFTFRPYGTFNAFEWRLEPTVEGYSGWQTHYKQGYAFIVFPGSRSDFRDTNSQTMTKRGSERPMIPAGTHTLQLRVYQQGTKSNVHEGPKRYSTTQSVSVTVPGGGGTDPPGGGTTDPPGGGSAGCNIPESDIMRVGTRYLKVAYSGQCHSRSWDYFKAPSGEGRPFPRRARPSHDLWFRTDADHSYDVCGINNDSVSGCPGPDSEIVEVHRP